MRLKLSSWLIIGANIIALITILSIAFSPIFYCDMELKDINSLNEIFKNIAFGVISGTIIYILIEFVPKHAKRKRAEKFYSKSFSSLYEELHHIFFSFSKEFLNNTTDEVPKDLNENDFDFEYDNFINKCVNFEYEFYKKNRLVGNDNHIIFFIERFNNFIKEADFIFSYILIDNLYDDDLILINDIRRCQFYYSITSNYVNKTLLGEKVMGLKLKKELYELYKLYLDFCKIDFYDKKRMTLFK